METLKDSYLTTRNHINQLEKLREHKFKPTLHFLSPFDNLIIQRKRLNTLFQFDYTIECYLPENKRKYGYWCLPVLHNNQFIARFDTKADRATGKFYIKSIFFEKKFSQSEEFNNQFVHKITSFARFNGCDKIIVQKADNGPWKRQISAALR